MIQAAILGLVLAAAQPAAGVPAVDTLATLKIAAEQGSADAQYLLGQAYQTGQGVTPSFETALGWYRRAAEQGHARAGAELGFVMFSLGDRRAAIPFIEKAAADGDPRAYYLLGTAHFNGDIVKRDWPLAFAQMTRASEAGLPAAHANLARMEAYLLASDRAKADKVLVTLPPVRRLETMLPPRAAPPSAVTAAPAPAATSPPSSGKWRVQLGAFASADRAKTSWSTIARKVPELASLDQRIVAAGRVQRLQAGGVQDRPAADRLCRQLRAAGADCLILAP